MAQDRELGQRISRKDAVYLLCFVGAISCVLLSQITLANENFARVANVALFGLLSVSFFHRAWSERNKQSTATTLVLLVGGAAWLVFSILIMLGHASGF